MLNTSAHGKNLTQARVPILSDKIPTCHPNRYHYSKGLCVVCYKQQWKEERRAKAAKSLRAELEYAEAPTQDNIPDLKIDGYWINQGDARKLPRLILV